MRLWTKLGALCATLVLLGAGLMPAPALAAGAAGQPVTCVSGCAAPSPGTHVQSSALESSHVICAAACTLTQFSVSADSTLSAAAWWVLIYDATSKPSDGAVTPAFCYPMLSGSSQAGAIFQAGGVSMTTGAVLVTSTTGCFTQTSSAHASFSGVHQ